MSSRSTAAIAIAAFTRKDYALLLNMADDATKMKPTWEAWKDQKTQRKMGFHQQGFLVKEVSIDVEKLQKYCTENQLANTAKVRLKYAQELLNKPKNVVEEERNIKDKKGGKIKEEIPPTIINLNSNVDEVNATIEVEVDVQMETETTIEEGKTLMNTLGIAV
ncbi:MAG: hypothetical protein ACPGXL_03125 [Chitinophagales bacterium]